jgi:hypothetical protein
MADKPRMFEEVVAAEEPDVRERIERGVLVARGMAPEYAVGCHLPSPRCGHATRRRIV